MAIFHFLKNLYLKRRVSGILMDEHFYKIVFDHYFFDLKYYLQKDASIEDFSKLLNISIQILEKISIEKYTCSFNILLNENRYKHLITEFGSPLISNMSINSILKLCGFDNNENFVEYIKYRTDSINKIAD